MAKIAVTCADIVTITDDNPRTENATLIRRQLMAKCPKAREIGDRKEAIRAAIKELTEGDILVVAGKGHEEGQIIGSEKYPFNDANEIRFALERLSNE